MTERVVAAESNTTDVGLDRALRPRNLSDDEFIGQYGVKRAIRLMIEAAKGRKEPVDHILLAGPPGLGKTTLAHIIATEMGGHLRITSGPALVRPGDLASTLNSLDTSEVLFIDEIHRLGKAVEEVLYPAMEDFELDIVVGSGKGTARTYRISLPPITVIGATTSAGSLTSALRDRFGAVHRLEFYGVDDVARIVQRSAAILGVAITESGAIALAQRSRGTARVCNRLLRRVRDYAEIEADGIITDAVATSALAELDVDDEGLDAMDRKILTTLMDAFNGGPAGLQALAATIAEDIRTLESYYEPFLLQSGFLARTPRGRVVTRRAYEHLDRVPPRSLAEQNTLL
jgi:Holliday junction DNA helicase RuvB